MKHCESAAPESIKPLQRAPEGAMGWRTPEVSSHLAKVTKIQKVKPRIMLSCMLASKWYKIYSDSKWYKGLIMFFLWCCNFSPLQHFIVNYPRHSVYVHLRLFLTENELKCTLEQDSISLEYHETAWSHLFLALSPSVYELFCYTECIVDSLMAESDCSQNTNGAVMKIHS